jgi:phosphoribosylglycinamide formyltransferase-1
LFKIAVLVSGNGSNLQSIIDAINKQQIKAQISFIVSSNPKAYALQRAKNHHIKSFVVARNKCLNSSDKILELLLQDKVDLVVLAGYLNILEGKILQVYKKRIINIHPALLPKYGGVGMYGYHVHDAVIKNKEKESGCTVHYVDKEIDKGEVILQSKVVVRKNDTPQTLAKRILEEEHKILPKAINKIKLQIEG